jgi:GTPase
VKGRLAQLARPFKTRGIPLLAISAATGEGLAPLLERIWTELARVRAEDKGSAVP